MSQEYKQSALDESIAYFTSDSYNQEKANRQLAYILEVVRDHCDGNISDRIAIRRISNTFPE